MREAEAIVTDRREYNAWADPKLWVSVIGVLLVIFGALLGFILSQLTTISSVQQTMLVANTETKGEVRALGGRVEKVENDIQTINKAFVYNLSYRLAYLEAKTGVKAPQEKAD